MLYAYICCFAVHILGCSAKSVTIWQVGLIRQIALHQMKKALGYVSDYQLKSACKDAIIMHSPI